MKTIFISGVIDSFGNRKNNIRRFKKAEKYLKGLFPEDVIINPCCIKQRRGATYKDQLKEDLFYLLESDTVVMLPGWEKSNGSRMEHTIAVAFEMEIIYYNGSYISWL